MARGLVCQSLGVAVLVAQLLATAGRAETQADPIAVFDAALAACAKAPHSDYCGFARAQADAVMVRLLAEAGNTRDRGTHIAAVRQVLTSSNPDIRASAAYALAKLQPDASDTPAIRVLLRDPVLNVRDGAWAAAVLSSDPAAKLVLKRVPVRPGGGSNQPDDPASNFLPEALGFALPTGAEYLALTRDRREEFQLEFLTPASLTDTLAWAGALGGGPPRPLADLLTEDPAAAQALPILDATIFGEPQVVRLPPDGERPLRLVLVYRDILFDQTGIMVNFGAAVLLVPTVSDTPAKPDGPPPPPPLDGPLASDELSTDELLRRAGLKPEAPAEETDLFWAVRDAAGYGAEDYLALYPDGAYAAEARAILAGPRLTLDALSYAEGSDLNVSFQNLPPESSATVEVAEIAADYATVAGAYIPQASTGETLITTAGALRPGVYLVTAIVTLGDGSGEIVLNRDFSVERAETVLTLDKAEYAPGEAITITFSGMSGDDQDYVATADIGSPNTSYLQYVYTQGAREGVVTLTAPTVAGPFEVRAFFREDESDLRGSVGFTVSGAAVVPSGTTVTPLGEPSPEARAVLTLDKASYAPGDPITITYSGMFGHRQDYLATSPAGSPNTSYLQYVYTEGALAGTATLVAPTTPGAYELRAFFKEDEGILRASVTFTVK